MDKKVILFKLFESIRSAKDEPPGTMYQLTSRFDEYLKGDGTRRKQFELILRISSHGGSTEEAISLYSYFLNLVPDLITVGYGYVESAALYVFLAGNERLCTPETRFFIHGESINHRNTPAAEYEAASCGVVSQQKLLAGILAKRTHASSETLKRWMRDGKYLYAAEALKYGFAHSICTDPVYERPDCNYVFLAERW